MQVNQQTQQQLQVKADDKTLAGAYANTAQVQFTKEEFVIDFMNMFPPIATLNARVILSPGHAKRLAHVLKDLVEKYEAQHGAVEASADPGEIGFRG